MVEREAFSVATLAKAMQSSQLDTCPIWFGDIKDIPLAQLPRADWVTGGYPCQPFSVAGKRQGTNDPRHLWPTIRTIVGTLQPRGVFFENVGGHISLGLDQVLQDLESDGYRCSFGLFTAAEVGAPHRRQRVFIMGLANSDRRGQPKFSPTHDDCSGLEAGDNTCGRHQDVAYPHLPRLQRWEYEQSERTHQWPLGPGSKQGRGEPCRTLEPILGRNADGATNRVDRLRALGNAVVPQQAERAFTTLWKSLIL
jgi:DNA (cytosine-5)-methyltransferase 1